MQGISQQPPILRFPEQLEAQVNGFSTEVDGLQKRVPSVHIKTLLLALSAGDKPLVHYINRDATERYMVVFANNTIEIYDLQGNKKTVNMDDSVKNYIATSTPRDTLRILTVADYTFVLNTTKSVQMTDKKSPDYFSTQGSMVYVKLGEYGRTYKVFVDGVQKCSFTTPDGSSSSDTQKIDTSYIADQINTQLISNGVSTDHEDNWIRIKSTGAVTTSDGFNNQALIHYSTSIQHFSSLPATSPDNYCVKVKGDPNGEDAGSYYVKYNKTDNVWEECVCPNVNTAFDANTLPHALVRNSDGTFTFKVLDWTERKVGDDDSNPYPSFVGYALSSIFFFRDRLGVSSKENVILSESGEFFNWWMTTANDLLDTDGIDIPVTSTKVNIINYMVVYSEDLYAFSNDTQFICRTDSVLSPKTASFAEITQFNSSSDCQPKVSGKNMYFPSERGRYVSVQEYYTVEDISEMKNAQDVTAHIPNYIPTSVYEIIPSTAENVLFCLTSGDTTSIYIYKYLFSQGTRIQSSWSKWTFDGEIYGASFIGYKLYLLIRRGNNINIESLDFSVNIKDFADVEKYRVYLDQKKELSGGVYDAVYQRTKFDLKTAYGYADISSFNHMCLITPEGNYLPDITVDSNGSIYVDGDYHDKVFVVGETYNFYIKFTTFYLKKNDNGNISSYMNGRTQLKYIELQYDHTGFFEVFVSFKDGRKYTYRMTCKTIGDSTAELGIVPDDTGVFKFPVHAKNDVVSIELQSDFPLPVALIGLTWECLYTTKAKGV